MLKRKPINGSQLPYPHHCLRWQVVDPAEACPAQRTSPNPPTPFQSPTSTPQTHGSRSGHTGQLTRGRCQLHHHCRCCCSPHRHQPPHHYCYGRLPFLVSLLCPHQHLLNLVQLPLYPPLVALPRCRTQQKQTQQRKHHHVEPHQPHPRSHPPQHHPHQH